MYSTGETIRKIRIAKGLTLQEIATNQLSSAFISKVERNESDISLSRFELILARLHVTYDEFSFIRNNYQLDSQKSFSKIIHPYINNDNVYGLKNLYTEEKLKL